MGAKFFTSIQMKNVSKLSPRTIFSTRILISVFILIQKINRKKSRFTQKLKYKTIPIIRVVVPT